MRGECRLVRYADDFVSILRYYRSVIRLAGKWLNRRSQIRSMSKIKFDDYMERYPLPKPKIRHNLYDLEFVT